MKNTLNLTRFHPSRETFITIFLILVLILSLLPFMATFNDILTRIVINLKGYWFIRDIIVPFEVKMVGGILTLFGMQVTVTKEYVVLGNTQPFIAEIIWNCIGRSEEHTSELQSQFHLVCP